jgi:hypothetical protein
MRMAKELTALESLKLQECERKITEGFMSMAEGLTRIRDEKLYRQHYKNYEDYCQERWGRSSRWAEQLIKSAAVVQQLPEKCEPMVRNERTARALGSVPEELRQAVVEHIRDAHKPVNSATVKAAAVALSPPRAAPKQKVYDQEGHEIPPALVEDYKIRIECAALMKSLDSIKERLESLRKGARIWKKISTVAESHIGQAIADIAFGVPHTVCTKCQGFYEVTEKGCCINCNSTGLMSLDQFQRIDKEIQQKHRTNHEPTDISRLSNSLS